MSEIIFVLGAGASKHCGTPLMKDFLDVARGLLRRGEVEEAGNAFANVMDAVGKLNAVHSKTNLDTSNVETVYTAFEMGKLLGKLPGIADEERIDGLTSAIRQVIGYTLEKTTKLPNNTDIPFPEYHNFTELMVKLIQTKWSFSVVTFNYDLGLDYTLYRNGLLPDYGLGDTDLRASHITYLKLHGSVNFGKCSNLSCGKVVPYTQFQYTETIAGRGYETIPVISRLVKQKCPDCGEPLENDPVIIPPTWNKTAYHEQIGEVWRRTAHEMKDAEYIFVMGYSLPATDWFFNYLYGLGVEMETSVQGFYVYNPDESVKDRFENLLGISVKEGRFHYYPAEFEFAVVNIPRILGIS